MYENPGDHGLLALRCRRPMHIFLDFYPVSMSLFCLTHSFVYLFYFCPSWDRSYRIWGF